MVTGAFVLVMVFTVGTSGVTELRQEFDNQTSCENAKANIIKQVQQSNKVELHVKGCYKK